MNQSDPFEDDGSVQTTTLGCPCGDHHGRAEYQDAGEYFRDASGEYTVLRCPNGHRVFLRYSALQPGSAVEPFYAEVEVEPVPPGASCVRR